MNIETIDLALGMLDELPPLIVTDEQAQSALATVFVSVEAAGIPMFLEEEEEDDTLSDHVVSMMRIPGSITEKLQRFIARLRDVLQAIASALTGAVSFSIGVTGGIPSVSVTFAAST